MELVDRDGDRIRFALDGTNRLQEFVNDKLECAEIRTLTYTAATGRIQDGTGFFQFRPEEQVSKALGLRALAGRAGVAWHGDHPVPAKSGVVMDMHDKQLEFFLTESGKLQEMSHGKEMRTIRFDAASGTISFDAESFKLPAATCIEQAAVLRSLAVQAGVAWTGDEPGLPVATPMAPPSSSSSGRVLEIEDCASDWEFKCPKRWDALQPTDRPDVRFCDTCKENVYFCATPEQLLERTGQRRCVAFRAASSSSKPATTLMPDGAEAEDAFMLKVTFLSGEEKAVEVTPATTIIAVKAALEDSFSIPTKEQVLVAQDIPELRDEMSLASVGITAESNVQLVRIVPPPTPPSPLLPPVIMGMRPAPF